MNLQTASHQIQDATRADRAGAQVGSAAASDILNFSKLGMAGAEMAQNLQFKERELDMASAEQEMSFRERNQMMQARQQDMNQSADLHPWRIRNAQADVQGRILNNLAIEQDIEQSAIKFPLDVERMKTDNDERRANAAIQAMNLKDRKDIARQAPQLSAYHNELADYNNLPSNQNKDPNAIPKPPANLTGKTKVAAWAAYENATNIARDNEGESAEAMARQNEKTRNAGLVAEGYLNSSDLNNPRRISDAITMKNSKDFQRIIGEFSPAPGIPLEGDTTSQDYNRLKTKYTLGNGFIDQAGLRNELNRLSGMAATQRQIKNPDGSVTTFQPRRTQGRKPMTEKEYADKVQEVFENSKKYDPATGKETYTLTLEEAQRQVNEMIQTPAPNVGGFKRPNNQTKHDLAQYMFALSRNTDKPGWLSGGDKWDSDVNYETDAQGREVVVPQKFGPSPDADNVVAKYRGKLDESGYDINPNMGEAGEGGAVPG